jgi:hypothetical protein
MGDFQVVSLGRGHSESRALWEGTGRFPYKQHLGDSVARKTLCGRQYYDGDINPRMTVSQWLMLGSNFCGTCRKSYELQAERR